MGSWSGGRTRLKCGGGPYSSACLYVCRQASTAPGAAAVPTAVAEQAKFGNSVQVMSVLLPGDRATGGLHTLSKARRVNLDFVL